MQTVELTVYPREEKGTRASRRMRRSSELPCVFYGRKEKASSLKIKTTDLKSFLSASSGKNVIVNLKIAGDKETVKTAIVKDKQIHPVSGNILHMDFCQISLSEKLMAKVALVMEGQAVGIKEGGVLEHHLREISVRCLPSALPEKITVNITHLKIGSSLHVKDLPPMEGVEIVSEKDDVIVSVSAPTELKAPAEEAAATTEVVQPEVIGEKERLERSKLKEETKDKNKAEVKAAKEAEEKDKEKGKEKVKEAKK